MEWEGLAPEPHGPGGIYSIPPGCLRREQVGSSLPRKEVIEMHYAHLVVIEEEGEQSGVTFAGHCWGQERKRQRKESESEV